MVGTSPMDFWLQRCEKITSRISDKVAKIFKVPKLKIAAKV